MPSKGNGRPLSSGSGSPEPTAVPSPISDVYNRRDRQGNQKKDKGQDIHQPGIDVQTGDGID